MEEKILIRLVSSIGKFVPKPNLFKFMYSMRLDAELPDLKIVDVMVSHIRKKLKDSDIGITIDTQWGLGYRIPLECKPALDAFLDTSDKRDKQLETLRKQVTVLMTALTEVIEFAQSNGNKVSDKTIHKINTLLKSK